MFARKTRAYPSKTPSSFTYQLIYLKRLRRIKTIFIALAPGDGGNFNNRLSDGRRGRLAHGEAEVLHRDGETVQDLCVNRLVLLVSMF